LTEEGRKKGTNKERQMLAVLIAISQKGKRGRLNINKTPLNRLQVFDI
jgi:hypothetical protein